VALAKERKIRRREHLEQHNEEYRLREQQGLSPPPALVNSSSDEEEESDGERTTFDRWEPAPPSRQAEGGPWNWSRGGRGVALRWAVSGGASRHHEGAGGSSGGAPQPSRKRKREFSNLR
jgi:hypothetical protein